MTAKPNKGGNGESGAFEHRSPLWEQRWKKVTRAAQPKHGAQLHVSTLTGQPDAKKAHGANAKARTEAANQGPAQLLITNGLACCVGQMGIGAEPPHSKRVRWPSLSSENTNDEE